MSSYGVIGGTLWGNRGAEAMVVTTIGRVRERDPDASFVIFSYYPDRDRALLQDPRVTVVDARPLPTVLTWVGAVGRRTLRLPDRLLPRPVRVLRQCRALFDVSGISFYDGRIPVVAYNLLADWPALLLGVPVIRLSQAMGPFQHPLNRLPARWVIRRSQHTFARGQRTASHLQQLGVPAGSWSVAPDVAFAYQPKYNLTSENEHRVEELRQQLAARRAAGTEVVGLVPSSVVYRKLSRTGSDYLGLLSTLVRHLHRRGTHVLVLPNATRAGVDATRNNDLVVIDELRRRLTADPAGMAPDAVSYVDFDLNTAGIRSLIEPCDLLVTSRFHAMVAALALGVPPLVVGWSHKYEEVLEMFGCQDDAIDFRQAEQELAAMVERRLADPEVIRERIRKALPEVTAAAVAQFSQLD